MRRILQRALACVVAIAGWSAPAAWAADGMAHLVEAEAYVDEHLATTPLTLESGQALDFSRAIGALDPAGLAGGPHTLYVRFRTDDDTWSLPIAQGFYLPEDPNGGVGQGGNNRLARAEVFVDEDPGEGNGHGGFVSLDGAIDQSFERLLGQVTLFDLDPGTHVVYLRLMDANGTWSPPIAQSFYMPEGGSSGGAGIGEVFGLVAAEAFFDTDPGEGYGQAVDIPLDPDGRIDDALERVAGMLDMDAIEPGIHTLYVRFRNAAGRWSAPNAQSVVVPAGLPLGGQQGSGISPLVAAEYAIDGGPYQPAPATDGAYGDTVELVNFSVVDDSAYPVWRVRFIDSQGRVGSGEANTDFTANDTDWDGLPDEWERTRLGGLGQGANDDPDHDGLSNREEFLRGTDPLVSDVLDAMTISGFVLDANGVGLVGVTLCLEPQGGVTDCGYQTDVSGHYVIGLPDGLAAGDYRVYPMATNGAEAFNPVSRPVTLNARSVSAVSFQIEALRLTFQGPTQGAIYHPGDAVTLTWYSNGSVDLPIELSMKRDSVPADRAEPLPDDPDWYRFTVDTPNDGSEEIVLPAGLSEASDWRFYVRHAASDVYDAAEATFTLEPAMTNLPPVVGDLALATSADTLVRVDLLAEASDPDGDPLGVVDLGEPEHGTLILGADGVATYTPEAGFSGTDRFAFAVSDGLAVTGAQAVITVTEAVVPDLPVADIESITPLAPVEGELVRFAGTGGPEDQEVETYHWSLARLVDGVPSTERLEIGSGPTFITDALTAGDWRVYLQVRNDQGLWSAPATRDLHVRGLLGLPDLALNRRDMRLLDGAGVQVLNAEPGDRLLFQVDARNLGIADTPDAVVLSLYLGDPGDGRLIARGEVAAIGAGNLAHFELPWQVGVDSSGNPLPGFGQGYQVISARLDYRSNLVQPEPVVEDGNRQNNGASTFLIVGDPPVGNYGIDVDLAVPPVLYAGHTVSLSGEAHYGWGSHLAVMGAQVSLELETGKVANTRTTSPQGLFAQSILLPSQPGDYRIAVRIFDNNLYATATGVLHVIALPEQWEPPEGSYVPPPKPKPALDLRIDRVVLSGTGVYRLESDLTAVVQGTPAELGAVIENRGDLVAMRGFRVAFFLGDPDEGGVLLGVTEVVEDMQPGTFLSVRGPVGLHFPDPGMRNVYVRVDENNLIDEDNEVNNWRLFAFDVRPPRPDLRPYYYRGHPVSGLYFSTSPVQGEGVTLYADIYNAGPAPFSGEVQVDFYDGDPDDSGILLGTGKVQGDMAVGERLTASVDWNTTDVPTGNHRIYAVVDPYDEVAEDVETNNRTNKILYVCPPYPDLWPLGLDFSNTAPLPGSEVELRANVVNRGGVLSSDDLVEFFVDGQLVGTTGSGAIPGKGGRRTAVLSWTAPSVSGSVLVSVVVDGHEYHRRLTIAPDPLPNIQVYSEDIGFDPPVPSVGDDVGLRVLVRNTSRLRASGDFLVKFYIDSPAGFTMVGPSVPVAGLEAGAAIQVDSRARFRADQPYYAILVELVPSPVPGDANPGDNAATTSLGVDVPLVQVQVDQPSGSATYLPLDPIEVVWHTINALPGDTLAISLRRDSAADLDHPDGIRWVLLTDNTANDGLEGFRIPPGLASGDDWRIQVEHLSSGALGRSAPFTLIDKVPASTQVSLGAADYEVDESQPSGVVVLQVARTGPADGLLRVPFALQGETATIHEDFRPVDPMEIRFERGQRVVDLAVPIRDDQIPCEGDETFTLTLLPPVQGSEANLGVLHEARVRIRDDDRYSLCGRVGLRVVEATRYADHRSPGRATHSVSGDNDFPNPPEDAPEAQEAISHILYPFQRCADNLSGACNGEFVSGAYAGYAWSETGPGLVYSFDRDSQPSVRNDLIPSEEDDREPLILIHGWQADADCNSVVPTVGVTCDNGEEGPQFADRDPLNLAAPRIQNRYDAEDYWRTFLRYFSATPALYTRYKPYLYQYPTYKHVTYNGRILAELLGEVDYIRKWIQGGRRITILAHSMGGLVARSALEEHGGVRLRDTQGHWTGLVRSGKTLEGPDILDRLITLSTPHHGSPGAIPAWVDAGGLDVAFTSGKDLFSPGAMDLWWDGYDGAFDIDTVQSDIDSNEATDYKVADQGNSLRTTDVREFDDYYRGLMAAQDATYNYTFRVDFGGNYGTFYIRPNPWLSHLNRRHDEHELEWQGRYVYYGGYNDNTNSHPANRLADTGNIGAADNSVFAGIYQDGYINDGVVPVTSMFFDQKLQVSDLTNWPKESQARVDMANEIIPEFLGDLDQNIYRGEIDGRPVRFIRDYHHDRMLNGGYYENGDDLISVEQLREPVLADAVCGVSTDPISGRVDFGVPSLGGYRYRTGFDKPEYRQSYVNQAGGLDFPVDDFVVHCFETDRDATWKSTLEYEPLFLLIRSDLSMQGLDNDNDVDRDDLGLMLAVIRAGGQVSVIQGAEGVDLESMDIDGDGRITALDYRKLVLQCTRPHCAVE